MSGGWRAGPKAAERTVEFVTVQIRNPHTRAAYGTAVTRFFIWCDAHGLALAQISPIAVATYTEARLLLDSIDTSTLPGLRDRALLGAMVYVGSLHP